METFEVSFLKRSNGTWKDNVEEESERKGKPSGSRMFITIVTSGFDTRQEVLEKVIEEVSVNLLGKVGEFRCINSEKKPRYKLWDPGVVGEFYVVVFHYENL